MVPVGVSATRSTIMVNNHLHLREPAWARQPQPRRAAADDQPIFAGLGICEIARRRFGAAVRMRMIMTDQPRPAGAFGTESGEQCRGIDLERVRRIFGDIVHGLGASDAAIHAEQQSANLSIGCGGCRIQHMVKNITPDLHGHGALLAMGQNGRKSSAPLLPPPQVASRPSEGSRTSSVSLKQLKHSHPRSAVRIETWPRYPSASCRLAPSPAS